MWTKAVFIFLGGGAGAITREFAMLLLAGDGAPFPTDIFVANILACFLLGLVFGLSSNRKVSEEFALLIGTGFTGGMSTFSSFIYGALSGMLDPAHAPVAVLYIVASMVAGYAATWLGFSLAPKAQKA